MVYVWLADFVVAVHVAYVACVVFGLLLVLAGRAFGWDWVRNRWFRGIHLAMILIVVARTTILTDCPLTSWEDDLREWGGQADLEASRVGYYLHLVIHPGLPTWVFPPVYVLFGMLVVATLWIVPVAWRSPRAISVGVPTSRPKVLS